MKKLILAAMVLIALSGCCNQNGEGACTATEAGAQKNAAVENMMNRRSIRSYKPEQITPEQLDTIIQCAINAPSARNLQPWEVRVVQNPELIARINNRFKEISKNTKEEFSVFHGSPMVIFVGKDKENGSSPSDCGMLAQNILLSAESMGIGTCVIGSAYMVFQGEGSKEYMDAINMPETHEVMYGISIGYKNESPDAKERDINKVQYIK